MKNEKKEALQYQIIIIVFLVSIVFIIGYYVYDANQLKQEPIYTKGLIVGKCSGTQGQSNVRYEFYVNNVKYVSSCGYSYKYDNIDIGDTCFVVYANTNPQNCKLSEVIYRGRSIIKLQKNIGKNNCD